MEEISLRDFDSIASRKSKLFRLCNVRAKISCLGYVTFAPKRDIRLGSFASIDDVNDLRESYC